MKIVYKIYISLCLTGSLISESQNIYTYAGNGTQGFSGDSGPAISAQLWYPGAVASDAAGNIYICDYSNNRIRKVDGAGIITTIAGGGTTTAEGVTALSAKISQPTGITVDATGNIYYSESLNPRVRKINTSGIVNTIAGNGGPGFSGDGGLATLASLKQPGDIAIDPFGNIYIVDVGNDRVRMVATTGTITTIAGIGTNGFSGDGGLATAAQLYTPVGMKLDAAGNIYIADYDNGRIRMINAVGTITTVAGTGGFGSSGDGGPATLAQIGKPGSIGIDGIGNLYLSDPWNNLIRKISTTGTITRVTGIGVTGYSGDGGLATLAQISDPAGIAFDSNNNVYFADVVNQRIRIICMSSCPLGVEEFFSEQQFKLYPNPVTSVLNISSDQNMSEHSEIQIQDMIGQTVLHSGFTQTLDVSALAKGMYTLKISSERYSVNRKFVKE